MENLRAYLTIPSYLSFRQNKSFSADRIALLYKQSPMGVIGTIGCAAILAYLFRDLIAPPMLAAWFGLALGSSLIRTVLIWRYFRDPNAGNRTAYWGTLNIASLGLSGIAWGAASAMIFPAGSIPHQFFLSIVICGMVAGASMAFGVMMRAFLIFTIPTMVVFIVRLVIEQSDMHLLLSVLGTIYWALSILIAINIRKTRLQLLKLKEDLADRVKRRTAELETANLRLKSEIKDRIAAQEQRLQLSAKLETARKLETIATLAGGMAHQFNNDLSVVTGAIALIAEDIAHMEETTSYVDAIRRTTNHMAQLTSQLLAYAQGGKYKNTTIDLTEFTDTTLALTKHTFPDNISVAVDIEPGLPRVTVDETQMRMAFSAIIANAVEAMTANGGQLTITGARIMIEAEDAARYDDIAEGDYVKIQFKDSGAGMPPEALERIFEPFFSTKFQGRGLAMAAVYGIVRIHQGHVTVASQMGVGTDVTLFLPAIEMKTKTLQKQPPSQIPQTAGRQQILLVEDEALVIEVNTAILNRLGYDVVSAENGNKAMALLSDPTIAIDLVMLDIKLPDMDGAALLPEIQQHRPRAQVVICSGAALDDTAQALLEAGAQAFIQKPFSLNALADILNQAKAASERPNPI